MRRRFLAGLDVSAVGFGCYRTDTAEHAKSLHAALAQGCNVFDTSSNYMDGKSEQMLGRVLGQAMARHGIAREQLVVSTKVGAIQGADLEEARQREAAMRPWPGVVKLSSTAWFCLSPEYVRHSVERSAERLGTWPDILLLHNPELLRLASDEDANQVAFYHQVADAFEACEAMTTQETAGGRGRDGIQAYGVSTNPVGCRWSVTGDANTHEATDLAKFAEAASEAARRHGRSRSHFGVVQLPLNLLEPHAAFAPLRRDAVDRDADRRSPLALARALGLSVMAHRPLNAIPPAQLAPASREKKQYLVLRETRPTKPALALLRQAVEAPLTLPLGVRSKRWELDELALLFTASAPEVDVALVGMRQASYVDRAMALAAACGRVTPDAHQEAVLNLRRLLEEMDPGYNI